MKKIKRRLIYGIISVVLLIVIVLSYVTFILPDVGKPENIKIALTPRRIARGEYLANHVTVCMDCHSKRDWTIFGAPGVPASLGGGGEHFDKSVGFPGNVLVPNVTPFNLKDWSDGEIFRAITCGVEKDGSAIFPLMPWPYYSKMSREDIYSIIAYLRTLKPLPNSYPHSKLDFPLNIIVHTIPVRATPGEIPDSHDTVKYGAYMVNSSACKECHTKDDKGTLLPGMDFAGGRDFGLPGGSTIRSANITPDKTTGIGMWTKDQFVKRFTMYADSTTKPVHVRPGDYQTIMPWWNYGKMKPGDLEAIYAYLRTVKPVKNRFEKFEAK